MTVSDILLRVVLLQVSTHTCIPQDRSTSVPNWPAVWNLRWDCQ